MTARSSILAVCLFKARSTMGDGKGWRLLVSRRGLRIYERYHTSFENRYSYFRGKTLRPATRDSVGIHSRYFLRSNHLHLDRLRINSRSAYFDEANEAAFGIVHRPWFESKLQGHLANPSSDEDPVWYALRNAIFATGCRIVLSRTRSFSEAKRESWQYFQNALSMNVQLLYLRTSLMSVQTMTIMVLCNSLSEIYMR